jgi:hypothetical protein
MGIQKSINMVHIIVCNLMQQCYKQAKLSEIIHANLQVNIRKQQTMTILFASTDGKN